MSEMDPAIGARVAVELLRKWMEGDQLGATTEIDAALADPYGLVPSYMLIGQLNLGRLLVQLLALQRGAVPEVNLDSVAGLILRELYRDLPE
jgi:hypothetical protein